MYMYISIYIYTYNMRCDDEMLERCSSGTHSPVNSKILPIPQAIRDEQVCLLSCSVL